MKFVIDEMFPAATCEHLGELGHDAVHVREAGLGACSDSAVIEFARRDDRAVVTENVKDYAAAADIVVVCVLKSRIPAAGMADHVARLLDSLAATNQTPYVGLHWPKS